ncbi:MAG: hypothetical protein R3264_14190 [Anaerolineae bacterium]|nr:hypothetical protein [Anaerolineae bacterium]
MNHLKLVIGSILVVALVAIGAFIGVQVLGSPAEVAADGPNQHHVVKVTQIVRDDGSGPVSLIIHVEPSDALPDEPLTAGGVFVGHDQDALLIGVGNIEIEADVEVINGERTPSVTVNHDGPTLRVSTTPDTVIYEDTTDIESATADVTESGEVTVSQVLTQRSSVADLEGNIEVQVWGERQGDDIVADTIVYRAIN